MRPLDDITHLGLLRHVVGLVVGFVKVLLIALFSPQVEELLELVFLFILWQLSFMLADQLVTILRLPTNRILPFCCRLDQQDHKGDVGMFHRIHVIEIELPSILFQCRERLVDA